MSQNIVAAFIRQAALRERVSLSFGLRKASANPKISAEARLMYRLASRYILGKVDSADYDIMARLQVLEGASGITPAGPYAGKWWKMGRRGLKVAQAHFMDTGQIDQIDPSWFSTGKTGMIGMTLAIVTRMVGGYGRGRETHISAEDLIQNGIMGLTKDGMGALSKGPIFFQVGVFNIPVKKAVLSGKATPRSVAGVGANMMKKKVIDEFKKVDLSLTNNVTEEGTSVFDMMPTQASYVNFWDFLVALLGSRSSEGRKLEQKMRSLAAGQDLANALIDRLVERKPFGSVSKLQKEMGGSGSGGAVRWIKSKFIPAVAKLVQNDQDLLSQFQLITRTASARRRSANKRVASKAIAMEMLGLYLDRKAMSKISQIMRKAGDKQSANLLREIQLHLIEKLNLSSGDEQALNRLAGLASRGASWSPDLIRNNIFKAANSAGIKLPSGMFASTKAAAQSILKALGALKDGGKLTIPGTGVYAHVWFDADMGRTDFGGRAPASGEWQVIVSTSKDPMNRKPRGQELARKVFRYVEEGARFGAVSDAEDFIVAKLTRLGRRRASKPICL